METIETIFQHLGGASGVGRAIGKSTEHAAAMRRRRSIPLRYWPKVIDAAQAKGVTIDEALLVAIHNRVEEGAAS